MGAGHTPAGGTGMGGGLQVQLLLPHARKLSSCNGYITHSGTPSLNGSQVMRASCLMAHQAVKCTVHC
jgi:hypothetical protein